MTSRPNYATNIILAVLIPVGLLSILAALLYGYCCRNRRCRSSEGSESQVHAQLFILIIVVASYNSKNVDKYVLH